MAKSFDVKLAAVRAGEPKAVHEALASTSGVLIAAAIAARPSDLDALPAAFGRLCEDGAKRDPQCRGKTAIVQALDEAERWEPDVFVRGLRYTQLEGYDQDDTAATLRAMCGLAHVRAYRPDALDVLAELLVDPARNARLGAAEALAEAGSGASPLLRLVLRAGEDEPEILAACAGSLLAVARDSAFDFVVSLLANHDERAEVAAVALGAARIPEAFAPVVAWCAASLPAPRHGAGFVALALLRTEEATAHLLEVLRTSTRAEALAAAKALSTFEEELGDRIRAAAAANRDKSVARAAASLLARR